MHLPVLFEFNIEISKHDCESDKEFVPKPLWGIASPDDLNKYKRVLNCELQNMNLTLSTTAYEIGQITRGGGLFLAPPPIYLKNYT